MVTNFQIRSIAFLRTFNKATPIHKSTNVTYLRKIQFFNALKTLLLWFYLKPEKITYTCSKIISLTFSNGFLLCMKWKLDYIIIRLLARLLLSMAGTGCASFCGALLLLATLLFFKNMFRNLTIFIKSHLPEALIYGRSLLQPPYFSQFFAPVVLVVPYFCCSFCIILQTRLARSMDCAKVK